MEKKDIKILIVPDVHGRDFWREPVKDALENYPDARIVFLGDYLDPYPDEWMDEITGEPTCNYHKKAVDTFKEIIGLKKENKDRITLLIGNHDAGYAIGDHICSCRSDRVRRNEISRLFCDNRDLFFLIDDVKDGDRHIFFSHAGINREYVKLVFGDEERLINEDNIKDWFNNAWLTDNYGIMDSLGVYSRYRGWFGYSFGSIIWADLREWYEEKPVESYGTLNVVGHTQLNKDPLYGRNICCLDCKRVFYLDGECNIRDYTDDKIIEKKDGV